MIPWAALVADGLVDARDVITYAAALERVEHDWIIDTRGLTDEQIRELQDVIAIVIDREIEAELRAEMFERLTPKVLQ